MDLANPIGLIYNKMIMDNQPNPPTISRFKISGKFDSKSLMIIGAVAILLVAGGVFWYWNQKKDGPSKVPTDETKTGSAPKVVELKKLQENVGDGLGASIYEKSQNPIVDKLSETNPFGKAPINPLKAIYNNPFE